MNVGSPSSLDGLVQGNSQSKIDDDKGYPYDLGNLHIVTVFLAQTWVFQA